MVGGFCEHGKLWTTCATCGKAAIKAAKSSKKSKPAAPDPWDEESAVVQPRVVHAPPKEPPRTRYEHED